MCRKEMLEVTFWLALAAIICIQSVRLDLGMLSRPGPGFMPFVAGAMIASLAATLFLQTIVIKRKQKTDREEKINFNFYLLIMVLSLFVAYTVLLYPLGYLICTFLLMLCLFSIGRKKRKWWLILVVAPLLVTVISYLVFCVWLQCPFPKGTLTGI